ncbi:sodium-coupled monocarboxylate transporter 1-like [Amphiura filiformis]|uniref:sodium-coupled monocarboxylate transporter 1-like n=1 Tax=Amphiura filiformis TaxID=82378 RepID=UPI003B21E046
MTSQGEDILHHRSGSEEPSFHPVDSLILSLMLLLSCGIGVFYAVTGGKQRTSKEFLMADQQLTFFPVVKRERIWGNMPGDASSLVRFALREEHYDSSPVVLNSHQYLELRFGVAVRLCALVCFYIWTFIYLGIVVYAPCLAVAAETRLSFNVALFMLGIVCIFYTTLGGMKAVVWADVFQMMVCVFSFLAVIIKGSLDHGGFQGVYNISLEGGRIDLFNVDPNPTVRHTVWSTMIGGIPLWTYWHGLTQYQVQRYLSCKTIKHAYW